MEVKIISTEMIRPASPTPPHLRNLNLGLLDQFSPHMFVPLILYYPRHQMGNITATDISRRLKSSLSQSLVQFYPLAGRFADITRIECNDQGVEFNEGRVRYHLEDLLNKPNAGSLTELVACHYSCTKSGREDALLAVQANFFDCGGMALGVSFSHLVGDMATIINFLKTWASTAEKVVSPPKPVVQYQHLFPQTPGAPKPAEYPFASHPTMKRFVIGETSLAALRQKGGVGLTRVEALTGLLCRCMARATKRGEGADKRGFIILQTVNLRRRMDPPLPDDAFGNFWLWAVVSPEGSPADNDHGGFEMQLREGFKKMDGAYLKKLQGPQGYDKVMEALGVLLQKNQGKEIVNLLFTSWCKFGYYEVDFGWGKPQWASPAPMPTNNGCIFMDQKEGNGVEVWVFMGAQDMAKFEQESELLFYLSPPQN